MGPIHFLSAAPPTRPSSQSWGEHTLPESPPTPLQKESQDLGNGPYGAGGTRAERGGAISEVLRLRPPGCSRPLSGVADPAGVGTPPPAQTLLVSPGPAQSQNLHAGLAPFSLVEAAAGSPPPGRTQSGGGRGGARKAGRGQLCGRRVSLIDYRRFPRRKFLDRGDRSFKTGDSCNRPKAQI